MFAGCVVAARYTLQASVAAVTPPVESQSQKSWKAGPVMLPLWCLVWQPEPQQAVPGHSQPSSALGGSGELQSWKPARQLGAHWPAVHERVALAFVVEHACPQSPQLA